MSDILIANDNLERVAAVVRTECFAYWLRRQIDAERIAAEMVRALDIDTIRKMVNQVWSEPTLPDKWFREQPVAITDNRIVRGFATL